jgi:hypothetical protein
MFSPDLLINTVQFKMILVLQQEGRDYGEVVETQADSPSPPINDFHR